MASSKSKNSQINLLPQEEFANSTFGRVIAWTLSTFRVIVVVTEVVVMGAFMSRFYLDVRISNLNDQIKTKTTIIQSSADLEKEFRNTQKKLEIVSTLISAQTHVSPSITSIASLLPSDVQMTSYSYAGDKISVRAITPSEFSISQLIANLKNSNEFNSFDLSQVSTSDTGGFFNFALDLGVGEKQTPEQTDNINTTVEQ